MKRIYVVAPLALVMSACAYQAPKDSNDASYTTRTNASTTVTVHTPPPEKVGRSSAALSAERTEPVGQTETTGAVLRAAPVTASAEPDASGSHPDRRLSERIQRVLVSDRTLGDVALERVRVTADGHRVTLAGIVPTVADKVAIEQRTREVKGVEEVDNAIEVLR